MTSETVLEPETERRSLRDRRIFTNILVVILGVIWGLAFVAIRTADFQLSPVNLTILRWLIASVGFLTLAPFFGKPKQPVQRHHIPRILVVSLASVTGYHQSLNYAETIVSAGLAGLLISLGPIFVVVLSTIAWLSVIYLALLSTVLANVILYLLIGNRSVSRLSIQLYIVPLVSLVGGIVLLGESVTVLTVFGAILMFTGVALATRKH